MPEIKTEELYDRLKIGEKTDSNSRHTDFQKKNEKTVTSPIEKPLKGKGLRFFDSIMESGPFVQKAVKFTAIGAAIGFALALLFPPLGIAVMTISAIVGVTTIGAKVTHSYTNTKAENIYNTDNTETRSKIRSDVVRELRDEKLSKEEIKQQQKKNGIKDDSKQNIETFTKGTRRTVEDTIGNAIKNRRINDQKLSFNSMVKDGWADISCEVRRSAINTNESRLAMFTEPLNSLNPNIKQYVTASKPKAQQKEAQSANQNMTMRRRNKL